MDVQTNGQMGKQMDQWMENFLSYTDATDLVIFTKALQTNGPTDRPTDGPSNQWMDIPSIAASKICC